MQVYCLVITHKEGTAISAYSKYELAKANLYEYVKLFHDRVWGRYDDLQSFDKHTQEEAIEIYFDNCEEFYDLVSVPLQEWLEND